MPSYGEGIQLYHWATAVKKRVVVRQFANLLQESEFLMFFHYTQAGAKTLKINKPLEKEIGYGYKFLKTRLLGRKKGGYRGTTLGYALQGTTAAVYFGDAKSGSKFKKET